MNTVNKTDQNLAPDFLLQRAMRDVNAEDQNIAETKRNKRIKEPSIAKRKYTRLNNEQKDAVLNKLLAGSSAKEVANEFGISLSTADNLRREYRRLCAFARIWKEGHKMGPQQSEQTTGNSKKETETQDQVV